MAIQVEVKLVCDYCATTNAGVQRATTTKRWGLDGTNYEVEVCDRHSNDLEKVLETWVRVSRRAGSKPKQIGRATAAGARKATTRRVGEDYEKDDYLTWAKGKGYNVNAEKRPNPRMLREFLDERASTQTPKVSAK